MGGHGAPGRAVAPPSGRLFQEDLAADPFWMLVACCLVNVTTWEQARPAFEAVRSRHPTPEDLARADPASLHDVLRPLGLWKRRAERLPRLANAWLRRRPARAIDVLSLPGCGRYAHDSWSIFVDGVLVEPNDGKLAWYVARVRSSK